MKTIDIVNCFDHNYILPAGVCIYSLLKHAKRSNTRYRINIVSADLDEEDKLQLTKIVDRFSNGEICFHNPPKVPEAFAEVLRGSHFSAALFYKLMLPEMFRDYNKIIVADVDAIYKRDIADVLDMLDGDDEYYVAGAWDPCYARWHKIGVIPDGKISIGEYAKRFNAYEREKFRICAGLMVYNIQNLRRDNIQKKWLETAQKFLHKLILPEQEIINTVCCSGIRILDWNVVVFSSLFADYSRLSQVELEAHPVLKKMFHNPLQIHYAGRDKPWQMPNVPMADLWFEECVGAGLVGEWGQWYGTYARDMIEWVKSKKILFWPFKVFKRDFIIAIVRKVAI